MPTTEASESSHVFLGVDGGGSHTRALAVDSKDEVVGSGNTASSNPHNTSFPAAAHNILDAISATGVPLDARSSLCLGIAGLANAQDKAELQRELLAACPKLKTTRLRLTHDLRIAHQAAFGGQAGIILIAGTGSACSGRNANGINVRASGRNYLYEDPGSGYAIGKRAVAAKLLLAADSRSALAALAPRVIELAAQGNLKALNILKVEAEHLAKLAASVYESYPADDAPSELALIGGLFATNTLYGDCVRFQLRSSLPQLQLIETAVAPVWGAIALAKGQ